MSQGDSHIRWSGEFADPELENRFADASLERARATARLCVLATTGTCLGFLPMDFLTLSGEHLAFFVGDRAVIAALGVAALMGLARAATVARVVTLTHAYQYVFFILNALIFNHPVLERHGGAMMPLIAIALLICLPGRLRAVAPLSVFAPGISLLFWGVLRPAPETARDLAMVALLTLVAYLVGLFARVQFNRMRREEYLRIEGEREANQVLTAAKEAAEAGSRAKADFLAVMSHEIRTPINGVLGMVRLVLDSDLGAEERRRLETACASAEGLLTILDDILDISKLEAGRVEFESAPFPLPRTIADVAALMAPRAREKGLDFTLDLAPDLPAWVNGDSARLRQVLFNLTGNAVKFTESGGVTVRATATPTGDGHVRVALAVVDTGIGIDAAQRDRLFQAFAQADASINRRFGGTGLGLVICKKLVEGMGGTIGFDSAPGLGSRFHVSLVFAPAEAAAPAQDSPAPDLPPLRVLLAEDNPVNREVALAYLRKAGHAAVPAANGAEAVELARGGDFDLVLMDMRMPQVDGLEATRRIRALPGPAGRVPIIALTANAMAADVERCHAAGMDGHIAKPIRQADLNDAIAQTLARRRG